MNRFSDKETYRAILTEEYMYSYIYIQWLYSLALEYKLSDTHEINYRLLWEKIGHRTYQGISKATESVRRLMSYTFCFFFDFFKILLLSRLLTTS